MQTTTSPETASTSTEETTVTTKPATVENGSGVCRCTCGQPVSSKSLYRPGHDARHVSISRDQILDGVDPDEVMAALPTDALRAKLHRILGNLTRKAEARKEREHAKAAAKVNNKKSAWTEAEAVKVGRWTYPARTNGKVTQRNEKRDGSGSWIAV